MSSKVLLLGAALSSIPFTLALPNSYNRRGMDPTLPHDPNTTEYCTWWIDNNGSMSCKDIPDTWAISMDDFVRWVSTLQSFFKSVTKVSYRTPPLVPTARDLNLASLTVLRRMVNLNRRARLVAQHRW